VNDLALKLKKIPDKEDERVALAYKFSTKGFIFE
jgi:hypothetical protein